MTPPYLTTAEAAQQMGVSQETVRSLCSQGLLPGAFQQRRNGPWRIPEQAVTTWLAQQTRAATNTPVAQPGPPSNTPVAQPGPPSWWERFRYNPWIFWPVTVFAVVSAVAALLAAIVGLGADLPGAEQLLMERGWIRAFPPAQEGQTLIVIATFDYSEGIANTKAQNEIKQAIEQARDKLKVEDLQIEVSPVRLAADDRKGAEQLGKTYDAAMVIWGEDIGVRVTVNFLNLHDPQFDAAQVTIDEKERVQLAQNPDPYIHFMNRDLPSQLTFLSLFAVGQSAYTRKDYPLATQIISNALDALNGINPPPQGAADAYIRLGWLYQEPAHDASSALYAYSKAIALDPGNANAYDSRAGCYQLLGELDKALTDYNQAIALDPKAAYVFTNRGNYYFYRRGQRDKALADYNQAIALEPKLDYPYSSRAYYYDKLGEWDKALADYNQAIALDPKRAYNYYQRANHYDRLNERDKALADYSKAIEVDPNDVYSYFSRARLYLELGERDKALADYNQAVAVAPGMGETYSNRANYYDRLGERDKALADYNQAIEVDPKDAFSYSSRALFYENLGELEKALADYNQAIALDHEQDGFYFERASLYERLGERDKALADYNQAIVLNPDEGSLYYSRGVLHLERGERDAASRDFRKTLDLSNDPGLVQMTQNKLKELSSDK